MPPRAPRGRRRLPATLLPVAHRELLALCRRPGLYRWRALTACGAAGLSLFVFATSRGLGAGPNEIGQSLFTLCTFLGAGLCLFAGPFLTADAISVEKRHGTLGLLFLTELRGYDVVVGKFVGCALPALQALVAVFPVLTLALFLGGLTGGELARTSLALLNLAFLSLAFGLLCSSLCRSGYVAVAASFLGLFALCAAGPLLEVDFRMFSASVPWAFNLPSPAYALLLARDNWQAVAAPQYWHSVVCGLALGWLSLAGAAFVTARAWHDRAEEFRLPRHPAAQATGAARRQRRASPLLDEQPLVWLARRVGRFGGAGWPAAFALAGALLMGWVWDGSRRAQSHTPATWWLGPGVTYAMHGALKLWLLWTATRLAREDRNSGALELLLVTPLHETDIWRGWLAVLKRAFLPAALLLAVADLLFWHQLGLRYWQEHALAEPVLPTMTVVVALAVFLADLYTLTWVGLWQGLAAQSAPQAFVRTAAIVLVLPAVCAVLVCLPFSRLFNDDLARLLALTWAWAVCGWIADLGLCLVVMNRVTSRLRRAVVGEWD